MSQKTGDAVEQAWESCVYSNKWIVLYTSLNLHDEKEKMIYEALDEAMKEMDEIFVFVKLHPDENPDWPIRMKKKLKSGMAIIPKYDLYKLMDMAKIVVTGWSTTAWEALAMNKPLIIVDFFDVKDKIDCVKCGVALGAKNRKELKKALKTMLYGKKEKKMLFKRIEKYNKDHLHSIDGRAGERVAKLINRMVNDANIPM
ncbi:CDP-glycerol glycerophosphotransferase family protein [Candidatus Woesearchaeota archaeon]|nr:CDP-glycerol glycerophosphotransferase family protein [Candidatus Woesearchaeota archaeon]